MINTIVFHFYRTHPLLFYLRESSKSCRSQMNQNSKIKFISLTCLISEHKKTSVNIVRFIFTIQRKFRFYHLGYQLIL